MEDHQPVKRSNSRSGHSTVEILDDLASLFTSCPLRNHEDILGLALENLVTAVCSAVALGPKVQGLLASLLQPIHGSPTQTAQLMLRQILPLLLSESTRADKGSGLSASKCKQLQFEFAMEVVGLWQGSASRARGGPAHSL